MGAQLSVLLCKRYNPGVLTGFGAGVAASISLLGLYSVVWILRTISNLRCRVSMEVAGPQVGFYTGAFGKLYYRASVGDAVFEVKPECVSIPTNGDHTNALVKHSFVPIPRDRNESLLANSPVPRVALKLPKFAFEIGIESADGVMVVVGLGFRAGDYLVTARHVFDTPGKMAFSTSSVVLRHGDYCVRAKIDPANYVFGSKRFRSVTRDDAMAVLLPQSVWAASTVRSIKPTDLSVVGEGCIEVYGRPGKSLMVSSGVIVRDIEAEARRGILSHSANTTETYSGSPIVTTVHGVVKLVGMHIAGGDGVNYGVSMPGLRKLLKAIDFGSQTRVGAVWDLLVGVDESKEDKRKQQDLEDDSDAESAMESEDDELVHGQGMHVRTRRNARGRAVRPRTGLGHWSYESPPGLSVTNTTTLDKIYNWLVSSCSVDAPPSVIGGSMRYCILDEFGLGQEHMSKAIDALVREGRVLVHSALKSQWVTPVVSEMPSAPPKSAASTAPGDTHSVVETTFTSHVKEVELPFKAARNESVTIPGWEKSFPIRNSQCFWSKDRSTSTEPLASRDLTACECECLNRWMKLGDWSSLHKLKGVGAQSLLCRPEFAEFRKYIEAGQFKPWKVLDKKKNQVLNARGEVHAFKVGTCLPSRCSVGDAVKVDEYFTNLLKGKKWKGKDLVGLVKGFHRPATGHSAVETSFRGQCARQKPGNWDRLRSTPGFSDKVSNFMDKYPKANPVTATEIGEAIDIFLDNMDGSKSAGWSSAYLPGSKVTWAKNRELLAFFVMCRLALRMAEGDNIHHLKQEHHVLLGLRDPAESFTKGEPHEEKKAQEERWRLIWICSMIDSVVQDVVHRRQNKKDILSYSEGHLNVQAVGLGHDDKGIERMGQVFDKLSGGISTLRCSDASGWDLSVCRDAIYFDAERRVYCLSVPCPVTRDLLYAEAACNSAHTLAIGGYIWTFTHYGITASGIPSTTAQNSPVRSFTLDVCGAEDEVAAGDDEVHTGDVDEDLLSSTGCITKEGSDTSSPPDGPVEFTSHTFRKIDGVWTATFNNFPKMLASLWFKWPGKGGDGFPPGMVQGMRFALRHTPEADAILVEVCRLLGEEPADPADVPWES